MKPEFDSTNEEHASGEGSQIALQADSMGTTASLSRRESVQTDEGVARDSYLPVETVGSVLRAERQARQMTLAELTHATRIPLSSLEALEADDYEALPGDVFVRGFIRAYCGSLDVEPGPIVELFDESREKTELMGSDVTIVNAPERGRRFGVAFALVVLLILFTLALSIVLRPRHRDSPVELSQSTILNSDLADQDASRRA